jgi:malate dehydrogenase
MTTSRAPLQVAVTGAAGQVGYAAAFRIAAGEMFGPDQPIILKMLEIEPVMRQLEALAMELDDCNYPLLDDMVITTRPEDAFDGVSWIVLLGAARRVAGMERGDLLTRNGSIFKTHGQAIAARAADDVRILVVGNPCNTNCLIARSNAREVPRDRWFAMMRLDQNRAANHLARKAGVPNHDVTNVVVWGNHSAKQYPDAHHALIGGRPAVEAIDDREWLEGPFISLVRERGAAIIEARGASSAASAATAVLDSVRSVTTPTAPGSFVSLAVESHGEYGIPEGLQFGFPVRATAHGWEIVEGLEVGEAARTMLQENVDELRREQESVQELLAAV